MINYTQRNIRLYSSFPPLWALKIFIRLFAGKVHSPTSIWLSGPLSSLLQLSWGQCCSWFPTAASGLPPPSSAHTPHTGLVGPGHLALRGRKERRETEWELEWRWSGKWGVSGKGHALGNCERRCLGRKASCGRMQEVRSMWEGGRNQTGEECGAPSDVAGLPLWKYLLFYM